MRLQARFESAGGAPKTVPLRVEKKTTGRNGIAYQASDSPRGKRILQPTKLAAIEVKNPIDPPSTAPPKRPTELFHSTRVPMAATSRDGNQRIAAGISALQKDIPIYWTARDHRTVGPLATPAIMSPLRSALKLNLR